MMKQLGWAALALAIVGLSVSDGRVQEKEKIRVMIIDGQNNHKWRETTPVLKQALESCGRFVVEVATSPERVSAPPKPKTDNAADQAKYKEALQNYNDKLLPAYRKAMAKFRPDLSKCDVVVSNYNGDMWSPELQKDLDDRLKNGKIGLVIVHAANNAFGGWKEYNLMIGMGWRDKKFGERLILDDSGKRVVVPAGEGDGSGHRYTGEFQVIVRDSGHPVTKGMPKEWLHTRDELYDNMRGPIANMEILATAYSKGTKAHEPMIWTVAYEKGRVFHTPMGHDANGMRCYGFIGTLQRGTEWAATGKVTLPLPDKFPTADKTSSMP